MKVTSANGCFMSFQLSYRCLFGVCKNFIVKGVAFYWMTSSEVKSMLIKTQSLKPFSEWILSFFRRSAVRASNVFSFPIHKAYNFFLWLSFILKFSQTFSFTQDVPCTSLMNIIKYCDYELSYLPKHDFQTLLYLPKRKKKKSMFAFDSCYRKLLVKSEAQQSRLCICQSLPRESCQGRHCHQLEIPGGGA